MDKQGQTDRYKSPWGVKLREIKLYDIIYDERDEKTLLKDIKHFEYEREYEKESNKVVKWARKVLGKFLKIHYVDMNVKPTMFTTEEKQIPPYHEWFMYTKVIGKVKDVYVDGQEMI